MLIPKIERQLFCAICLLWLCCHNPLRGAVLTGVDPTIINVGTGTDTSYLIIDESTLYSTPLEFVYHYTYDSAHLITTEDMMNTITNASSLRFTFGSTYGEVQSLSYAGTTIAGTDFSLPSGFYWSLYFVGGLDAGSTPTDPNQWNYGNSGINSGRTLAPDSWDGITYSGWGTNSAGGAPSVAIAAVPEPAALPLVILSLATLMLFAGWKYSTQK